MDTESGYLPIQALDIEAGTEITFDLYVNLPLNQKYLLYKKRGATLSAQKTEASPAAGPERKFFIHKNDHREFVKYVARRIKSLIGGDADANSKTMMTAAAKAILSSTFSENDSAVTDLLIANLNEITKVIIESALETSSNYNKQTFRKFSELAQKGTDFQKHPMNVASLAVFLTFGIGYSNEKILVDVAMAGLLHDIGISRLTPELMTSSHSAKELAPSVRAELYRHPEYAIQILKERKIDISPLLETLIMQHHEEFNGTGYPDGRRGFQINELSQVLKVADELDQLILQGYSTNVNLKLRVIEMIELYFRDKIIEPTLCTRLRGLLV